MSQTIEKRCGWVRIRGFALLVKTEEEKISSEKAKNFILSEKNGAESIFVGRVRNENSGKNFLITDRGKTILDSGGAKGYYGNGENNNILLAKSEIYNNYQYIELNGVVNMESGLDFLKIYETDNTNNNNVFTFKKHEDIKKETKKEDVSDRKDEKKSENKENFNECLFSDED
mgnify:CR=1 FL=1